MTTTLKPVPQAGMLAAGRAWPYMAGITAVTVLAPLLVPQLITLPTAIALSGVSSILFAGVAFFFGMHTKDGIRAYWEHRLSVLSREIDEFHQFSKSLRSSIEEFQVEHYPELQKYGHALPTYAGRKLFKRRYNQLWAMMTGFEYLAFNFAGEVTLRDEFLDECHIRYSDIGRLIEQVESSEREKIPEIQEEVRSELKEFCSVHHNLIGAAVSSVYKEISRLEDQREQVAMVLREGN